MRVRTHSKKPGKILGKVQTTTRESSQADCIISQSIYIGNNQEKAVSAKNKWPTKLVVTIVKIIPLIQW